MSMFNMASQSTEALQQFKQVRISSLMEIVKGLKSPKPHPSRT